MRSLLQAELTKRKEKKKMEGFFQRSGNKVTIKKGERLVAEVGKNKT